MTTDDTTPATSVDWSGATASESVTTPDDTAILENQAAPASGTAPALNPVRWSGKKTAVAAALALGLSSIGAVGAAAAHERGTSASANDGRGFPGQQGQRGQRGQFPRQGTIPQQGQVPQPGQLTPPTQ